MSAATSQPTRPPPIAQPANSAETAGGWQDASQPAETVQNSQGEADDADATQSEELQHRFASLAAQAAIVAQGLEQQTQAVRLEQQTVEAAQAVQAATLAQASQAEQQTEVLREILWQMQEQTATMKKLSRQQAQDSQKLVEIEKATHFLERRSDSPSGLQSDWSRHRSQAVDARAALARQRLSIRARQRKERQLLQEERFEIADRLISLLRGSCLMFCLQPALTLYTGGRLAAQIKKDEAEAETDVPEEAGEAAPTEQSRQ